MSFDRRRRRLTLLRGTVACLIVERLARVDPTTLLADGVALTLPEMMPRETAQWLARIARDASYEADAMRLDVAEQLAEQQRQLEQQQRDQQQQRERDQPHPEQQTQHSEL